MHSFAQLREKMDKLKKEIMKQNTKGKKFFRSDSDSHSERELGWNKFRRNC